MRIELIKKKIILKLGHDLFDFLSHSKNYVTADFFSKSLIFITLPIITRILTPEEFGIIAIFLSIISMFEVIMELNFRGAVTRYYYEGTDDFKEFLGSNCLFMMCYNILFIILFWFTKNLFSKFFVIDNSLIFFYAIIISSSTVFMNIYLYYLQASKRSKEFSFITVIQNTLILITSIFLMFILNQSKYMGRIYGNLIISIIILFYISYKLSKVIVINFKWKHILYSLSYGLPLLIHTISGVVLVQFDRIIINQAKGAVDTGLYSFAYQIGMIMSVIVMGMTKAWVPIFYEKLKNNETDAINKLSAKYAKYIYFMAFCLILFSSEIGIILSDKKYYSSFPLIPIVTLSYVFLFIYTQYSNYAFYRKKTFLISASTVVAGTINIALNYLLIPKYGYFIAAFTTLFSYFMLFLLHFFNTKYILRENNIIKLRIIFKNFYFPILGFIVYYLTLFYVKSLLVSLSIKILVFIIGTIIFLNIFKKRRG